MIYFFQEGDSALRLCIRDIPLKMMRNALRFDPWSVAMSNDRKWLFLYHRHVPIVTPRDKIRFAHHCMIARRFNILIIWATPCFATHNILSIFSSFITSGHHECRRNRIVWSKRHYSSGRRKKETKRLEWRPNDVSVCAIELGWCSTRRRCQWCRSSTGSHCYIVACICSF